MKKVFAALMLSAGIFLLVLTGAAYRNYEKGSGSYETLKEEVIKESTGSPERNETDGSEMAESQADGDEEDRMIDWEKLKEINPDIIAWIVLPSGADYPVVQGDDDHYYLTHDIFGEESETGAIFMEAMNSPDLSDDNTVIYGHNTIDGSMFGSNKKYLESDYCRENSLFYIYTCDAVYTIRLWAVLKTEDGSAVYNENFGSGSDFEGYIDSAAASALYVGDEVPEAGNHLVTLSTCCDHARRRLILQGFLMKKRVFL